MVERLWFPARRPGRLWRTIVCIKSAASHEHGRSTTRNFPVFGYSRTLSGSPQEAGATGFGYSVVARRPGSMGGNAGRARSLPVGQQIHWPTSLGVDRNRPVGAAGPCRRPGRRPCRGRQPRSRQDGAARRLEPGQQGVEGAWEYFRDQAVRDSNRLSARGCPASWAGQSAHPARSRARRQGVRPPPGRIVLICVGAGSAAPSRTRPTSPQPQETRLARRPAAAVRPAGLQGSARG